MASVTATLRRTDDRVLERVPVSTPAALGFLNAAVAVAAIVAAVHGVGTHSSSQPVGAPAAVTSTATDDGTSSAVASTGTAASVDPAGGAAATGKTPVWTAPTDVAAAFVKAAAKGDCTTLSAATGKTAAVRAKLSTADFCKREKLVFRGFTVLKATRTSGSSSAATVDVRVHGIFGTSDLIIRTSKSGKDWTVSAIS